MPSLCHLLVWYMMPELYLSLLPYPLLPFWLLYIFFYVLVLFFSALPLLFFPLWFSKGRSAPAQPGTRKIVTKAQVGFSPAVIFFHYALILCSRNRYHFKFKHPARFLTPQIQQKSGSSFLSAL